MRQTATAVRLAPLWEPATVLPSQLDGNHGRAHRPELHLVSAIFEDALHCVFRNVSARRGRKRREFLDACDWFWSEAHDWPFAFVNVCDLLGIEGRAVRDTIRTYIVSQHKATASSHPARHWGRRMLRNGASPDDLSPCERLKITGWDEV
jgi:hypothetical protein